MRRYNGNTGRYEYIPDGVSPSTARYGQGTGHGASLGNGQGAERGASLGNGQGAGHGAPLGNQQRAGRGAPHGNGQRAGRGTVSGDRHSHYVGDGDSPSRKNKPPSKDMLGSLQNTLSNLFSQGFENEDLLLFAVLFLMYQETGDKELLIIMGGMFLL